MFKLYVLNGEEVFFGLYPILRHAIQLPSGTQDIYDPIGKDATVFHYSAHSGSHTDKPFIDHTQAWFADIGERREIFRDAWTRMKHSGQSSKRPLGLATLAGT